MCSVSAEGRFLTNAREPAFVDNAAAGLWTRQAPRLFRILEV